MLEKLLLSVSTLLLFCTSVVSADNKLPIKLGALLCLSGECAEIGTNSLRGAQLAVDELNESGGVLNRELEIISQDSLEFSSGANALKGYQSLKSRGDINYFIGPTWTVGALPLAPIVSADSTVLITSPSVGVATFNEAGPNVFNLWPHDSAATQALAELAIKQGWKKAVVFSNQNPWEHVQAESFKQQYSQLGGAVIEYIEPLASDSDLKVYALRAVRAKPDVIFFSNYTQVHIAARELRSIGYQGAKLLILLDETRLKGSQGALEGAIVAEVASPTKQFVQAYQDTYGERPGIAADTGYDIVKMYAEAIRESGTTEVQSVQNALQSITTTGASGAIRFDKDGGVTKSPVFREVKGDRKVEMQL